ncbi:amino acid adenylation domain-containing protein [Actinacidiphila glaucinigra]|uniref:non-ribosomal peptide synthetase n=1 Tax=Actinacidiphila glaucinigra TaxID=235986 RepID=UPI003D8EA7E3
MSTLAPSPVVGVLADPGTGVLIGMLAASAASAAFLPLDPQLPDARLDFMMRDCRVRTLLADDAHQTRAEELARRIPGVRVLPIGDSRPADPPAGRPGSPERETPDSIPAGTGVRALPDEVAYVIYTSGSTGTPKGVAVTHANLAPLMAWSQEYFGLGPGTRVLQNLNPAFDFGTWELVTTVCAGGTLYFPGRPTGIGLGAFADAVARWDIDTLHTTPAFFAELVALGRPLPSLRQVHLGGEKVTGSLVRAADAVLGADCLVHNGYGPTEATVNCAIHTVDRDVVKAGDPVPIGRASARNLLYVLSEDLVPVAEGEEGELVVGGPGVALGYVGREALTAERFLPDPFSGVPGARMYRSGDLVRLLPDGELEYLGRIDHQVKIRGHRVELGEIESVLTRCPEVAGAVVVAAEEAGADRLVGYVLLRDTATPGGCESDPGRLGRVRAFAAERLPGYMVPAHLVLVDRFPLTPNGKVDRKALLARGTRPLREERTDRETAVRPAAGPAGTLAGIWADVLGLDIAQVGPEDNFFDLGGDSLSAMRIAETARRAGIPVDPTVILTGQTVEAVLAAVESEPEQGDGADLPVG